MIKQQMNEEVNDIKLIGKGREAEVFIWKEGWVLKLFYKKSIEKIEQEIGINKVISSLDLPVPQIQNNPIKINGRLGIVFEQIQGKSMLNEMTKKPWKLSQFAKALAEQHAIIHKKQVTLLPDQKLSLINQVKRVDLIDSYTKNIAIGHIESQPASNYLSHGDYHPDNILVTDSGLQIIDWTTATSGNPLADVARTSITLRLGELPPDTSYITKWAVSLGRSLFHWLYLRYYFKNKPLLKLEFHKWLLPVAISRLAEGIQEEQEQLLLLISSLALPKE